MEGALTKSSPTRWFPSFFGLGIIAHSLKYKVYLGYATKVTQPHASTRVTSPGPQP
jgi:hypothetical protein